MFKSFLYVVLGLFVYSSTFAQGKLLFTIDIVRHGDRTPIIASPGMKKIWPYGEGQLTPIGMHQEYELGKILRKQYVDQYHLLPNNYDINTMNVRSSAMPRTMMSAQSLLYGLYPLGTGPSIDGAKEALPEGFQPIPINTVPRGQDSLLLPINDQDVYIKLLETYVFNQPEWVQKNHELTPYYAEWSKIIGIPIRDLFDLINVSDRLKIERLYHTPLPKGLSEKEATMIIDAGEWAFINIANHPKLALLVGGELVKTIKKELTFATEQQRQLKYLLFVAHDTTILAQLKLLGRKIDALPPYTSRLNYSLFDMGSSNYEVRISYNQKPLFIERCGGEACTLGDFIHLVDEQTTM